MSNLQNIRKNNEEINKKIKQIIEMYKAQNLTAFNNDGTLHDDIKTILEYEMKKCVLIYLAEFPGFECKDINKLTITVLDKLQPECRGGSNGITVYMGIQPFLDKTLKKSGIEAILVDGKVCATKVFAFKNGKNGLTPETENGKIKFADNITPPLSVSHKMADSPRDQLDYFAELLITQKNDIDWILDCLPHEAMHIFIPGKGVFVEGTTERLARECADKYNLRLSPTSHQKETEIATRLELIIGKDKLASIMSLTNEQKMRREQGHNEKNQVEHERLAQLKDSIDSIMGNGIFEKLHTNFKQEYEKYLNEGKYDFGSYRNEYYSNEIRFLDQWISKHPEQLIETQESPNTHSESKLCEILHYQEKESSTLDEIIKKLQTKDFDKINKKSGFNDCMQDQSVRTSSLQEATTAITISVHNYTPDKEDNTTHQDRSYDE